MVQNCIKFFTELILDWISSQAFEIRTKYQVEIFSSTLYSAYPSENQLILESTKLFLETTAGDRIGLLMFALGPRTKNVDGVTWNKTAHFRQFEKVLF